MLTLHSYGKIHNLGHKAIANLFLDAVIVQEKVDGSQFSFGVINGELYCRSRGKEQHLEAPDKMFEKAVEFVKSIKPKLVEGWTYRAEYLAKPKHNTLCYNRTPKNNLVLFDIDIGDQDYMSSDHVKGIAESLDLEPVPTFAIGIYTSFEQFKPLLEKESVLGGPTVEGVVVKNYNRFGQDGKALMGKYVSEKFKEKHIKDWKERNPFGSDIKLQIGESLKTEARWHKSIQHLRERGELLDEPKDIGPLLKEINQDVLEECKEEIMETLFNWAWKDISRLITRGFPEWYKQELAKLQFMD